VAENARLDSRLALGWPGAFLSGSASRRAATVLVAAASVLALLLVVLQAQPLAALPGYPAVLLAFATVLCVPGFVIAWACLRGRADALTLLAASPAFGLALAAAPGFIALEGHTSFAAFKVMYAFVAAAGCGVALFLRGANGREPEPRGEREQGMVLLVAAVAIAFGGILTTPLWANDRLAGDYDDWTYMAYVREYIDAGSLNESEPFLGTDEEVNPRMRSNVWVLTEAMLADAADVPPAELLLEYLRPVLTVAAVLAAYALTRALFRAIAPALLAAAFLVGYALIDLSPHEGFGRNLLLRISEDKMVGAFVLFPIGLLFLLRFVEERSRASYAGFTLVVVALAVVHPVPLVFLAIAITCFAALRAAVARSRRPLIDGALLLLPVALAAVWPFIQRQLLIDVAPDLFDTGDSDITFRDEFHVVHFGFGLLMGNYHMVLHPLVILAVVLAPLVWLGGRSSAGHQLVLAVAAGALAVFFVPVLATPVANLMTPQTLWKVPWMIMVAPALGYATWRLAEAARRWGRPRLLWSGRIFSRLAGATLPVLGATVVLGGALVVQELYFRVDGGDFYDWNSPHTIVPGTEQSIFRGGLDRGFSRTWRLTPYDEELFGFIERNIEPGSTLLIEPTLLNHLLPGMIDDIHPVDFGGTAGAGRRREDVSAFAAGKLSLAEIDDLIDLYGVDYVIVTEVGRANQALQGSSRLLFIDEEAPYAIYVVLS